MSFVIPKPLPYDKVVEITLKSIAPTNEGAKLLITGEDAEGYPVEVEPYFGHPIAKKIFLKGIMTQLEMYGNYANMEAAYKAVVKEAAKGTRKVKVKLVYDNYIDKNGCPRMATQTIFDPKKLNVRPKGTKENKPF